MIKELSGIKCISDDSGLCSLQGVVLPGQVPADGNQSTPTRQPRRKRTKVQLNSQVFYQPGVPRTKHSGVTASLRAPVGTEKLRPSSVTSESGVEMTPFEQHGAVEVCLCFFFVCTDLLLS